MIEGEKKLLPIETDESDVRGVGKSFSERADDLDFAGFECCSSKQVFETISKLLQPRVEFLSATVPQFQCCAHTDNQCNGFRAGAHARLLEDAEELRGEFDVTAYDERANANWASEFVGSDSHRCCAQIVEIQR